MMTTNGENEFDSIDDFINHLSDDSKRALIEKVERVEKGGLHNGSLSLGFGGTPERTSAVPRTACFGAGTPFEGPFEGDDEAAQFEEPSFDVDSFISTFDEAGSEEEASQGSTQAEGWKEIVLNANGEPRQAGADLPEGQFIKEFRALSEKNLFVFSKGVLGYKFLSPHVHREACDWLTAIPPYRKLLMLPRLHAKSAIVSQCLPFHVIIQSKENNIYMPGMEGSDCRVLLACETEGLACRWLRVIKATSVRNQLMRAFWPGRFWENPRKDAGKWSETEIIFPRATEWPDPTVRAIGVGGAITGARPNILIGDDLISLAAANSDVVMQGAIEWLTAAKALLDEYEEKEGRQSLLFLLGCLPGDAEVLLEDGTRREIALVRPGDRVWAADTDKGMCIQRVSRCIYQGHAETLQIVTTAHSLKATANHPFLAYDGKRGLAWKRADALKVDDLVVSCKEIPGVEEREPDFCWLIGFLFGDGWINCKPERGYVCFVPGVDESLNQYVLVLLKKWFPAARFYMNRRRTYRADSQKTVNELAELGLSGTSHTKRLPDWVFKLAPSRRRDFLLGFLAADGWHYSHSTWGTEIANKELLCDLRHLANLCGVRTSRMVERTRFSQPPGSPEPVFSRAWWSTFNFATVTRKVEMCDAVKGTKLPGSLRFERVTGILRDTIAEPVYDLVVEGSHSFFANGLAVHNTHWAVWDLYTFIEENDPSVEILKRSIIEIDKLTGEKKIIWPERWTFSRIEQLKKEFGSMFPLLYMNEPFDPALVVFDVAKLRYFDMIGTKIAPISGKIKFQEDERDTLLHERMSKGDLPTDERVQAAIIEAVGHRERGKRLTADNFHDVFAARDSYVKAKFTR